MQPAAKYLPVVTMPLYNHSTSMAADTGMTVHAWVTGYFAFTKQIPYK